MNPYETDPSKIPASDLYIGELAFGRYTPEEGEFKPDPRHISNRSDQSSAYWDTVLDKCTPEVRIYESMDRGRDVFALGAIIVKSNHLKPIEESDTYDRTFADRNEIEAIALVRKNVPDCRVPSIYFAGMLRDRDVIIQERLPGVALCVAWPYLTQSQKDSFLHQARDIVRSLTSIVSPYKGPSYVVEDSDPVKHRGITDEEVDILFTQHHDSEKMVFTHNDLQPSNIIVSNDRIVGIIDWEMSGWFSPTSARLVHTQLRTQLRESFVGLNLSEDLINDIVFWAGVYAE